MSPSTDLISGFDESDLNKLIAASDAGTASQLVDIVGQGGTTGLQTRGGAAGALFGFPAAPVPPDLTLPEIVLLHGITDCHLANTVGGRRNRIWLDFMELFKGSFIRDLPLQADGVSDQPGVNLEPDGHVAKKYDQALAAWTAAGFRNRVFCYDWRRDVASAADHLYTTLSNLPSVKAGEKVVLVAHSMGGLVAAALASRKADWENLVHHCIFVGSPLGGSYSVPMTVLGHSPSFQQMDRLSILDSLEDFQRMAASFPGLIDMLPNPTLMPEAADFYTEAGWPGPVKPRQALLDASRALKDEIWQSPIFAKATHIISQGHATTSSMPWNDAGTDRLATVVTSAGDGAALTKSSLAPGLKVYLASGEHGTLVNEPRIHQAIIAIATGGTPNLPVFNPTATPATRGTAALALPPAPPATVVPAGLVLPGIPAVDTAGVALAREVRLGDEMALHFSSEAAVRARTQISGEPGFDRDKLTDSKHFWHNALSLAIASLDAYRSDRPEMPVRAIQDWGFTGYEPFAASDTEGFVCWDDRVVVLSFRGTEKKISDWLGNLNVMPRETAGYGSVHGGFHDGYKAVEGSIKGILKKAGAGGKKLWITGHSLGGALSSIAGVELYRDTPAYGFATYGQPKLATRPLMDFYNSKYPGGTYARFKNNNDIVTRIPPGYDHVGKLYWFNANGELKSSSSTRGLALAPEVMEAATDLGPGEFNTMQAALRQASSPVTLGGLSLPLADYQVEGLSLIPSLGISDHSIAGKYIPILRKYI